MLFLANASGVLTFDGKEWETVGGTENLRMFKFAEGGDGKIYTGGIGDLGYLGPDSTGKIEFQSLKSELPDSASGFERIFRVASDGEAVYFLGGEWLFTWTEKGFEVLQHELPFRRVFTNASGVFVTDDHDVHRVRGNGLEKVGPQLGLGALGLRSVISGKDLGLNSEDLWLVTSRKGIFRFAEGSLIPLNPALDSFSVFNVGISKDKHLVLGTNGNGLVVVDHQGNIQGKLDAENGLRQSQAVFPYLSKDGAIWCPLFSGLSRVELDAPLLVYGEENGLSSFVLSVLKFGNGRLVGTTEGAYYLKEDGLSVGGAAALSLDIGNFEVNDILPLGEEAVLAGAKGLYRIGLDLEPHLLESFGSLTTTVQSSRHPERFFLGLGDQRILIRQFEGGKWNQVGTPVGIDHHVITLAEDEKGHIWASYDGISRISFPSGDFSQPTVLTLDSTHGLTEAMGLVEVAMLQGRIAFGSEEGIYRWDETAQRLVPDPTFGTDFANGRYAAYNLTETRSGDVWVTTGFTTGILRKQPDNRFVYDSLPVIRAPISDYFSIYEDPDGIVWLGGTEALVRFDPNVPKDYHLPYYTLVRGVTVNDDSVIFHGTYADAEGRIVTEQPDSYVPTLTYDLNHLSFKYAAPFFDAPEKIEYSHQLVGLQADWTPWTNKTECEFTNLKEGSYTFQVKARNVYGTISSIGEYSFQITAPWYRTTLAYILYGILVVLGILGIVRLRTRTLRAAKKRLEGIVDERTEEIQRQMEVISQEKEKSENLLLNILPRETSEELKAHGAAKPKEFESVSVLFTDFKGFTMIAEQLTPEQLVEEIHHCFSAFDKIAERHGIEKIKTIGDAYMAAGGLPTRNDSHPVDVVKAALEIRDFMLDYRRQREAEGRLAFEIRLGVHTGPVVAGIVGLNKFQYDIWGDAVNLAARMESSGEVGKVNVSEATCELVKDHFACTPRGKVKAKNKGEVSMFFVEPMA